MGISCSKPVGCVGVMISAKHNRVCVCVCVVVGYFCLTCHPRTARRFSTPPVLLLRCTQLLHDRGPAAAPFSSCCVGAPAVKRSLLFRAGRTLLSASPCGEALPAAVPGKEQAKPPRLPAAALSTPFAQCAQFGCPQPARKQTKAELVPPARVQAGRLEV